MPVLGPVSRRVFLVLLALNLLLRLLLATLPGYESDVELYRDWAIGTARWGIPAAYETTSVDYPPLVLYALAPIGHLYLALHPEIERAQVRVAARGRVYSEYFFQTEDGRSYRSWRPRAERPDPDHPAQLIPGAALLSFGVKLLFLPFDLLLAALLYALVSVGASWGEVRRGSGWGRLAALLFLWNPASLFDTAYWGQLDSLHCLLAVAAVALLGFGRWLGAGFLLSAACLMKPLAAPLVPLLVAVAAVNGRGRGFLLAGVGGLVAALLALLPFLVTGRISLVFQTLFSDLDLMPYASINAHSIWWLFGGWRNANAPWIGPLTPKVIGQLLFGGSYLFLLVRSRPWMRAGAVPREEFRTNLFVLAATITISFFFLSTHMHENHLLMAVPLLFAIAGRNRPLARLAALCCLGSFLNMALHSQLVDWIPGFLGSPARVPAIYGGPVTLTWFQLVAAALNTVLLAVVAAGSLRMAASLGRSGARR